MSDLPKGDAGTVLSVHRSLDLAVAASRALHGRCRRQGLPAPLIRIVESDREFIVGDYIPATALVACFASDGTPIY